MYESDDSMDSDDELEDNEVYPFEKKTAEDWKADGNDLYRAKRYQEAITAYGLAIQLDGENNPPYYLNRAAAYLMMKKYQSIQGTILNMKFLL